MIGNPFTDVPELCSQVLVTTDGDRDDGPAEALRLAGEFWPQRHRMQGKLIAAVPCDGAGAHDARAAGVHRCRRRHLVRRHRRFQRHPARRWPKAGYPGPRAGADRRSRRGRGRACGGCRRDRSRSRSAAASTRSAIRRCRSTAEVVLLSNGEARLETMGTLLDAGPTAVLRFDNFTVVVLSRSVSLFDRALYFANGCDPRDYDLIVVKSPHTEYKMYDAWVEKNFNIDAPGRDLGRSGQPGPYHLRPADVSDGARRRRSRREAAIYPRARHEDRRGRFLLPVDARSDRRPPMAARTRCWCGSRLAGCRLGRMRGRAAAVDRRLRTVRCRTAPASPVSASVLGARLDEPDDIAAISARVAHDSMDLLQAAHTLSGIEMALWDLLGSRRGLPVWADARPCDARNPRCPMPRCCSATRPRRRCGAPARSRAQNYAAAKFGWGPIGTGSAAQDAEHFAAAREGMGPEAHVMIDVGQIFGEDVEAAAGRLPALQAARATWLEEPFDGHAFEAYAALAARSGAVGIAGGEAAHNVAMARHLMDYGQVEFMQIDCGRIGGIGPAHEVARLAASARRDLCEPHLHLASRAQRLAAALCRVPRRPDLRISVCRQRAGHRRLPPIRSSAMPMARSARPRRRGSASRSIPPPCGRIWSRPRSPLAAGRIYVTPALD